MNIHEAIREGEKDPTKPLPISAGRCEAIVGGGMGKYGAGGYCGKRASWWVYGQYRCGKHKMDPAYDG